jgi:hypothetical protein
MRKPPHLFISYSQRDGDAASALLDLFETAGISCFLAEKSIGAGKEWDQEIRNAIRQSERMLVLITPQSRESVWVAAEIGAAWILDMAVIPALQGVDPGELHGPISKYHGRRIETPQQVASLIDEICASRPGGSKFIPRAAPQTPREEFTASADWQELLRIGQWQYESHPAVITGEGMYRYLLSHNIYGPAPFRIDCRISFLSLRPKNSLDAVNAGIVLGWTVRGIARSYYHLAFSGTDVFFELIGSNGRDEYVDFRHLSPKVRFKLAIGKTYEFQVRALPDHLELVHEGQEILTVALPFGPLVGRVGLRPWRSTIQCHQFDVAAEAEI